MNATTSAYRFTRHADEYAVTTREGGGILGKVRRVGATWHAEPATIEQGAHLYVTEYHTRHNAAVALDAAHREEARAARVETTGPVEQLAPDMYRVRVTVTNRDGVHTVTEDMNPAAIELARTRPGWSVEIPGEAQVTIVGDGEPPTNATATPDCTPEPVWASGGPGKTAFEDYRWECGCGHRYGNATPQDGDVNAQHAAHLAAETTPADRTLRVIRPAYTIETGDRIILDGDTVTVLDVDRDDTARTVTLTTSYGAPRTVMDYAAVPVVVGEEDAAPPASEPLAVGETFTRMVRGVGRRAKPRPVTYTVTGYAEGRGGPIVLVRSDYQGDGSMPVSALREYLADDADRRAAVIRPIPVEMQRQLTGERQQVDRGTCDTCKTGCGHRFDEVPGCTHYGCIGADGATADTCPGAQAAITGARVETNPRTAAGTPENIDARASARARGELAAQASLTFDESDRQAMTGARLRAMPAGALALF